MLSAGYALFISLVVVFVWRQCFGWKVWHRWQGYVQYCSMLYGLLFIVAMYAVVSFYVQAFQGQARTLGLRGWLRIMMLCAPAAMAITYVAGVCQTVGHVEEIRKGRSVMKHDRAVMIVALPAVYSVCAMCALTHMYQYFVHDFGTAEQEEKQKIAKMQSDTCFWVGDLYEAWALYQFGKLTLDLIGDSIARQQHSQLEDQRRTAQALMNSHTAVESLAWMGIILFLVVCFLQPIFSIYVMNFAQYGESSQNGGDDWEKYNSILAQFTAAGMVASAAAIWNVHVVESTFHEFLADYLPLTKFITVKILVTFAFFQREFFDVLKGFNRTLPGVVQNVTKAIPLLGDILEMSEAEFELFYAALMTYECLGVAITHLWAWSAKEVWYVNEETGNPFAKEADKETKPLVTGRNPFPKDDS